jgi:pimeloyl-ACP methyl ester carboxylesterase
MPFADSDGTRIYYDDRGTGEPTILCLPGWCVHHTIYAPLAERLSADHRVLAVDWRGHGDSQQSDGDFGYPEMVADVIAVIEDSGANTVITIAQAHGGWVAVELRRRLGERVPKMIFISWNPIITAKNPLAPQSLREAQALQTPTLWQALQDEARWRVAVKQLVSMWVGSAPTSEATQIWDETGTHGYEMWSRGDARSPPCLPAKPIRSRRSAPSVHRCPCSTCMPNPVHPNSSRHRSQSLGTILGTP